MHRSTRKLQNCLYNETQCTSEKVQHFIRMYCLNLQGQINTKEETKDRQQAIPKLQNIITQNNISEILPNLNMNICSHGPI
jgi:recombinational DNA repair protein RecR